MALEFVAGRISVEGRSRGEFGDCAGQGRPIGKKGNVAKESAVKKFGASASGLCMKKKRKPGTAAAIRRWRLRWATQRATGIGEPAESLWMQPEGSSSFTTPEGGAGVLGLLGEPCLAGFQAGSFSDPPLKKPEREARGVVEVRCGKPITPRTKRPSTAEDQARPLAASGARTTRGGSPASSTRASRCSTRKSGAVSCAAACRSLQKHPPRDAAR